MASSELRLGIYEFYYLNRDEFLRDSSAWWYSDSRMLDSDDGWLSECSVLSFSYPFFSST
jgi:hypothetical protein